MSSTTYVLLPPSESKEPGGGHTSASGLFDTALAASRQHLVDALDELLREGTHEELQRLFKVRGALFDRAIDATRLVVARSAPVLPAWQRFTGVVWSHLDPASLSDAQRQRVLIPSGLYGLSSGTDPVADFRLTMKVGLAGIGNVASFWRPHLTRILHELPEGTIVNLLPKEHDAAIAHSDLLMGRMVVVHFVRHGGEGVAGHDAKAAKGVLARRILDNGLDAVEAFRWKGWRGRCHRGRYEVRAPRAVAER